MDLPVAGPSNRFLVQQRDRRWQLVLSILLIVSGVLLVVLGLVGWPRLKSTAIHYDLIRLRAEVLDLQREEHRLAAEFERERSPARLAERAESLGLVQPPPVELPPSPAETGAP